jgi:hypothetical protein
VAKQTLIDFLSCYGEVTMDVLEVGISDYDTRTPEEENHMGSY